MANRLQKKAEVSYTPGSPYVPGKPAYCVADTGDTGIRLASGSTSPSADFTVNIFADDSGETHVWASGQVKYEEPKTTTSSKCYSAEPGTPATPGTVTYSSVTGWDAGGRSIAPLIGDGGFRFEVSQGAIGAVVGLVAEDYSQLPNEATHAFYVHGNTVEVMESGTVVATAPTPHDAAKPLLITRAGSRVFYLYDGWVHASEAPITADPVYLDAALYASGDYIDNPALLAGAQYGSGALSGSLPALEAFATDASSYGYLRGKLAPLLAQINGTTHASGTLYGVLPPLAGMLVDRGGYGQLLGALPALLGDLHGGFPETTIGSLVGVLPPLSGYLRGYTGGNGTLYGVLPSLAGMLTNRAGYGELRGELPAMRAFMLTLPPVDYGRADNSILIVGDLFIATARQSARAMSALQLSDTWVFTITLSDTVFEALALSSDATAYRVLTALAQSGLLLGGDSGASAAAVQYAVNVLTGALTTYSGFDFGGFALAGDAVYACRPDGLYRLRPGDDDGSPIAVSVDFGTTDYGSVKAKTVQDVFLGLTTDGEVIVTLRSDGTERSYRATARGPMMRATAARGAMGRRWNLALEVADATEFELDTVEHVVGVAARRQIR